MLAVLAAVAGVCLLTGCPAMPGDEPDADLPGQGLRFAFLTEPQVPEDLGGTFDLQLTYASLRWRDFRAIGDAAPGDFRTTAAELDLEWAQDVVPAPLVFDSAPPGVYSTVQARVEHYSVAGTVVVDTEPEPFEIVDSPALPVVLSLDSLVLEAGQEAQVDLLFSLESLVEWIDWEQVAPDTDGVRRIDENHSLTPALRGELADAFGVD